MQVTRSTGLGLFILTVKIVKQVPCSHLDELGGRGGLARLACGVAGCLDRGESTDSLSSALPLCTAWGLPCTWTVPWYKFLSPTPNSPPDGYVTSAAPWPSESPSFRPGQPHTRCLHARAWAPLGATVESPKPVLPITREL